ncbi:hypothetical protein C819_00634 [Lachnospiraceae bacterium 10-1]|nr:hypothetical protein C819_00634 [Lachnospiraceae bacterium 10-1]
MRKYYNAVKIVLFFIIIFVLVGVAAKITERKDSRKKYQDFMELADQIDVLFLGSSHVLNGINPVQLYSEYGITSYNMGKPGGMVTESYWTLMNALDYCTPKCVVVDLWALDRNYKYLDIMNGQESEEDIRNSVSLLHTNMDIWPISKTKIAAVNDLISDPEIRKEFLWNFTLYHGRWSSITAGDFKPVNGQGYGEYLLGAEQRQELYLSSRVEQAENTDQTLSEKSVCEEYLYKILEECRQRDIDVVLTFLPMAVSYDQDRQAVNRITEIAAENNLPFLNLLPQENQSIVDYYTDMSDDTHLNANGMYKVTSYIGGKLKEAYGLPDHREDDAYAGWKERADQWRAAEIDKLANQSDLYAELGEIQYLGASAIIYLRGDSKAIHDSMVRRFIKHLTGSEVIEEAFLENGPYLLIRDTSGRMSNVPVIYEFSGETQVEGVNTFLGPTTYIGLKDYAAVYVNEDFENNYLDMEEHYYDDVQIIILGQQGEVISHLCFDSKWQVREKK